MNNEFLKNIRHYPSQPRDGQLLLSASSQIEQKFSVIANTGPQKDIPEKSSSGWPDGRYGHRNWDERSDTFSGKFGPGKYPSNFEKPAKQVDTEYAKSFISGAKTQSNRYQDTWLFDVGARVESETFGLGIVLRQLYRNNYGENAISYSVRFSGDADEEAVVLGERFLKAAKTEHYTWIIPGTFAIGPYPIHQAIPELKKAGFKAILSASNQPIFVQYQKDFHYLYIPTKKNQTSQLSVVCRFINDQRKINNPVFIHSLHGKGRAAAIAAAYLISQSWLNVEEAVIWMRSNYDAKAISVEQEEDLKEFAKYLLQE